MIAILKIQCTDNSGKKIGDFLLDNNSGLQITPTFDSAVDLFKYCNNHFPDREQINDKYYKIKTIIK